MGQLWNGAFRMMVIKVNVLKVLILHYKIGFVEYKKEAQSKIKRKKRGIREEKRKMGGDAQRPSRPGMCKLSY